MSTTETAPPTTTTTVPGRPPGGWTLTTRLTIEAWRDPLVENTPGAIPTASEDALVWWTPSIGTIAVAVAHRFSRYAADGPSRWTIADIAATFGVGASVRRVQQTLGRLERFGITRRVDTTVAVRLWLPPLTRRQQAGLPAYLAAAYLER